MGLSLRDQLLQAGLLDKNKLKQASHEQRRPPKPPKPQKNAPAQDAAQRQAAERAQAEKRARDQALNQQQRSKAEAKARSAQVKQLIEQYRLPKVESDDYFNFIVGKKIKRMPVDAAMRGGLSRGELAIVRHEGMYAVVPAAAAQRIAERDERAVVPLNLAPAAVDENDPYKDFVVPDDLVW
ncbi:MAG: DUF2058 domain-containing protein [Nevskia sp.]|nr:DUF2058 domain-containing protein [Nevskia sp.]